MATAYSSMGTVLQVGNGATPEVFTAIARVVSLAGPGIKINLIDVTHLGSTDSFQEFIAGLKDGGSVTFDVQYDPAETTHGLNGIIGDASNATPPLRNYEVVLPDNASTTWEFVGLVESVSPAFKVGAAMMLSVSIKVSGAPDFDA